MRSFAIVIRRAYFEAKKRRKYAKNVVVSRSGIVFPIKRNSRGEHPAALKLPPPALKLPPSCPYFHFNIKNSHILIFTV